MTNDTCAIDTTAFITMQQKQLKEPIGSLVHLAFSLQLSVPVSHSLTSDQIVLDILLNLHNFKK